MSDDDIQPKRAFEIIQDAFPESRIEQIKVEINMFEQLQEHRFILDGANEVRVLSDGKIVMTEETAKRLTTT